LRDSSIGELRGEELILRADAFITNSLIDVLSSFEEGRTNDGVKERLLEKVRHLEVVDKDLSHPPIVNAGVKPMSQVVVPHAVNRITHYTFNVLEPIITGETKDRSKELLIVDLRLNETLSEVLVHIGERVLESLPCKDIVGLILVSCKFSVDFKVGHIERRVHVRGRGEERVLGGSGKGERLLELVIVYDSLHDLSLHHCGFLYGDVV
jgi:hypothetical protein